MPRAGSYDETIEALNAIVEPCARRGDRVGYFAAMYLAVTNTVRERAAAGAFEDAARMERFVTEFAGRYLEAHDAWRNGAPCPRSWRGA